MEKLGNCLSMIKNGANISQKKDAGGLPITRIETLSNDKFNRDRLGYADIYDASEYEDYILEDNDILMSHINSREFLGRAVLYKKQDNEQIIHGMNLLRLKTIPEKLDPIYAYYLFQTKYFKKCIQHIRKDAINQSSITISDISQIDIELPPLGKQKKIANFLYDIDRKIDINNKTTNELEAIAKKIYDYWFVQFDFPNKEGKPYKSSGGKMVWEESLKREIPYGWKVSTYGKEFEIKLGGTPSTEVSEYWDKGTFYWMNSGEVQLFPVNNTEKKITQKAINNSSTELLPIKSVLISITRHLRVTILGIDACINQSVVGFAESDKLKCPYTYFALKGEVPRLMNLRTGAQQPHINKETVENSPIIIPEDSVLGEYYLFTSNMFDSILNIGNEILSLESLRAYLLPLLMNGQVTIKD